MCKHNDACIKQFMTLIEHKDIVMSSFSTLSICMIYGDGIQGFNIKLVHIKGEEVRCKVLVLWLKFSNTYS